MKQLTLICCLLAVVLIGCNDFTADRGPYTVLSFGTADGRSVYGVATADSTFVWVGSWTWEAAATLADQLNDVDYIEYEGPLYVTQSTATGSAGYGLRHSDFNDPFWCCATTFKGAEAAGMLLMFGDKR